MMDVTAWMFALSWPLIGFFLGRRLHGWLKLDPKWKTLVVWLVVLAPVVQEVLGRIQFAYLCNKHAVVWLSPDWQGVRAARAVHDLPNIHLKWTVIPIRMQRTEANDIATGKPFMKRTALHTDGGFFLGTLRLGLDNTTTCWPGNANEVYTMINIDMLIKNGETK